VKKGASVKKIILAAIALALSLLLLISPSWAKRASPAAVTPAENGKYYITAPCCYMGGIKVYEPKTKKFLWKMRVYNVQFCEEMERDVQDVHIKNLDLKDDILKVVNESGDVYEVDLVKKTSKAIKGALVIRPYARYRYQEPCDKEKNQIVNFDSEYSTREDCDSGPELKSKGLEKKK
jgi:hypothetical protein